MVTGIILVITGTGLQAWDHGRRVTGIGLQTLGLQAQGYRTVLERQEYG